MDLEIPALFQNDLCMFFESVVLDKVRLVDLDTLFTALFVPCSVSAALLILILLIGTIVLSLEFMLPETSLTTQNKQEQ